MGDAYRRSRIGDIPDLKCVGSAASISDIRIVALDVDLAAALFTVVKSGMQPQAGHGHGKGRYRGIVAAGLKDLRGFVVECLDVRVWFELYPGEDAVVIPFF